MLNVEHLASIFHILCVVTKVSLLWMCTWRYIQNDSTSLVDFRTFQQREKDIYPSFSLCFRGEGIYEQKKLNKTEIENYKNFLQGDYWDNDFLGIEYDDVTLDLMD